MTENQVEILLVEDNPNDVELTLHAFKSNHVSNFIHVVRDGAEALEYIFCEGQYEERKIEDSPRLILLDLKLPKVDGLEVLRQIRSDDRTKSIPVVILTSSDEERDVIESYKLGVNSYIRKPVDFEKFSKVVKDLEYYWLLLNIGPPNDPSR
ncbi:MAG: response regulator [Anaerolineales bacterium]